METEVKMRREKGITLIALVVTIIVLLILAGVSISMLTGQNGILTRAGEAKTKTEEGQAKEKIEMILLEYQTEKALGKTLEEFLNKKLEKGEISGITQNEDGTYEVEINGYVATIDEEGNIVGEIGKAGPRPEVEEVKVVANSDGTGENLGAKSQEDGNTLYITFKATIEGGTIKTITESKTRSTTFPYPVTANGKYTFTIVGTVSGTEYEKTYTVTVNQFNVGLNIGDLVNYEPDEAGNYSLTSSNSGSSSNAAGGIAQDKTLQWKILDIDENDETVTLISAKPTNQTVYFSGPIGYNNGVYLINDICKQQYSNSELGVTARSLTIDDIEKMMSETGKAARDGYTNSSSGLQYNKPKKYGAESNYYPIIYAQENKSGINTETTKTDGIGISDKYYTGENLITKNEKGKSYEQAEDGLTVTQTYYGFSIMPTNYMKDATQYNLIFETGTYYWLASRFADCSSTYAYFGLRSVYTSCLFGFGMFSSNYYLDNYPNYLRPVVSLESSLLNDTSTKINGVWQINKN